MEERDAQHEELGAIVSNDGLTMYERIEALERWKEAHQKEYSELIQLLKTTGGKLHKLTENSSPEEVRKILSEAGGHILALGNRKDRG